MLRSIMFYAVKKGRKVGIFSTWKECETQVKGFKGAKYKKFSSEEQAYEFIGGKQKSVFALENVPKTVFFSDSYKNSALKYKNDTISVLNLNENHKTNVNLDPGLSQANNSKTLKKTKDVANDQSEDNMPIHYLYKESNTNRVSISTQTEITGIALGNKVESLEQTVSILRKQVEATNAKLAELTTGNKHKKARKDVPIGNNNGNGNDSASGVSSTNMDGTAKKYHVYTDGACQNNGKFGARAGIGIYWGMDHPCNTSARLPGKQTNNRAEIQAAVIALYQAKSQNITDIVLYSDSNLLIQSVTKWMHGWKKKNWTLQNGHKVKNKDDLIDLEEAMQGINVEWVHVRGHAGIHGNEMADKLAVKGISDPLP